ncbi:MAG: hypothetical protein KGZ82_08660 [Bacteroidales bacterium]|nr:hypothetical protein [Bacteroidales bacterium]
MDTENFYSKSQRISSPSKRIGYFKIWSGIGLLIYTIALSGNIQSFINVFHEEDPFSLFVYGGNCLVLMITFFTGVSFILSGIISTKRVTITPEIPSPFKHYVSIFDNLLNGKLEIYKFPDYGPLKIAFNYVSDKIPYLTPPKRKIVSKNVSLARNALLLALIVMAFVLFQKLVPESFYQEFYIERIIFRFPFVFFGILLLLAGISFYSIILMIPENIPRQTVSENFATINGGGDPNSIFPAINKLFNEFRYNALPNYSFKSGFAKIEDLSFNETGSYDGKLAVETHPQYIGNNENDIIPNIYLLLAAFSLITSLINFALMVVEPGPDIIQSYLGNFFAGLIFLYLAGSFISRAFILNNIFKYDSVFTFIDVSGSIGKSEITAGKAITDSIETKNVVIRSDSQFRIYTTRFLSESYSLNGSRYVTAMITDDNIHLITEKLLQTINNFKAEGVSVRGIDISSESLNQITRANLLIHDSRKNTKSLPPSPDQKAIQSKSNESINTVSSQDSTDVKECPRCAETIKARAKMCRFCNFEFPVN